MKYKIFITDDHTLIANAMEQFINEFKLFTVIGHAVNGKVLLEKLEKATELPDVILLDISMPIMDGYETAKHLAQLYPDIKVMALTMQADDDSIIKMIKSGACGYLQKNCSPIEFEIALEKLVNDGNFFPSWINNKLFIKAAQQNAAVIKFSERELEILKLMATELSYKEIGEQLFLSSRTIETYRDGLFQKIGVNTRMGLAIYAIKNKFVEL